MAISSHILGAPLLTFSTPEYTTQNTHYRKKNDLAYTIESSPPKQALNAPHTSAIEDEGRKLW